MSALLYTLLLTGTATAQMTTAFPYPINEWGTDKMGFVGSVLGVSDDRTSYRVIWDNGVDTSQLRLGSTPSTVTLGPSFFGFSRNVVGANNVTESEEEEDDKGFRWGKDCTMSSGADAVCSEYFGPAIASKLQCGHYDWSTPANTTRVYEYSARSTYSAGTDTIVKSVGFMPSLASTGTPGYCSETSVTPTTTVTRARSYKKEDIATYQLVVTAGLEKLSATGGSTGAAAPMKTMGPMGPVVAGLGAAAAFFL